MKYIKIFAPATVANVACGFDIFGFALNTPGDEIVLRLKEKRGIVITKITGDDSRLPTDPKKNTAAVSIMALLDYIKSDKGFEIEIHKKMPLSSGLGSSAASAAGALFGANILLGKPLEVKELLPFAIESERTACGTGHADNVAPALLGGFVIIRSYSPLDIIKIPAIPELYCTVIHPSIEINTEYARSILKSEISLGDAVKQWGNVAGLVTGLFTGDYNLTGRSLEDVIIEPLRAKLIPGFYDVKKAALKSGALGCSISGSGPSIFALCSSGQIAEEAGKTMKEIFNKIDIRSHVYISEINEEGPKIIEQ
ncbi:MAG: homoserine kinase [Candidatus Eremiobacterota bacterium]